MLRRGEGASEMLKQRKSRDANVPRLSHLLTELAKKISNSLGDSGERATEVPGLMLYRGTAPTVPNPSTYEPSDYGQRKGTLPCLLPEAGYIDCSRYSQHRRSSYS